MYTHVCKHELYSVYTHTVPNLVLDKERVCYSYGNLIIRLHLPRLPARISPTKKEQNGPTSSLHVFNNSRLLRIKNSLSILSRYEFIPETHRHSHWTRLSNNMKVLDRKATCLLHILCWHEKNLIWEDQPDGQRLEDGPAVQHQVISLCIWYLPMKITCCLSF